jgi:predicted dehydrogenase
VRLVEADFGFRTRFNPESRLLNPELGGGALLDVGIYPISLTSMILGRPQDIVSTSHLGETGVDEQFGALFRYEGGRMAIVSAAVRTATPHYAVINGTEGRIIIHPSWWKPTRLTVLVHGKETTEIEMPIVGNGYNFEAEEVGRCLREGKLESDIMPLDETLYLMEMLDTIRAQWGLKYPME